MKKKINTTMTQRKHLKKHSVRLLALAATGLLLMSGLTACGASASKNAYVSETMAAASGGMYNEAAEEEAVADYDSAASIQRNSSAMMQEKGMVAEAADNGADASGADGQVDTTEIPDSRKLIRNVDLSFETTDFDTFVQDIQRKTTALGGYIESSDLSGNAYTDRHRYAYFTLRIPKPQVDTFLSFAEGEANLTRKYENTQDITLQYYDTESRKKALQSEYDRLLELMAKAESVDAVIAIEQRLSEIRYQLDSFESDLRRYDNQVDYSTITVNVSETTVLTASEKSGFWSRVQANLESNLEDLCDAGIGFLIWFLSSLPVLLALAILFYIIYRIVKMIRSRRKFKKATKVEKANLKTSELKPDTSKTPSAETHKPEEKD